MTSMFGRTEKMANQTSEGIPWAAPFSQCSVASQRACVDLPYDVALQIHFAENKPITNI